MLELPGMQIDFQVTRLTRHARTNDSDPFGSLGFGKGTLRHGRRKRPSPGRR